MASIGNKCSSPKVFSERRMRRPDFFIVGAPKCGTTALYEYLKQHPEVFMPREVKEPHFFGSDFNTSFFIREKQEYLSLFANARDEKRVGEASVWYLYSKKAAAEIKDFAPAAKIIVMLRNPIDMMHALHSQRLFNGSEDIMDFSIALNAEEDRKRGLRMPPHPHLVEGLFYREVAKYTEQVQRYLEVFGAAPVKIIIYDDFKQDTARVYREVCAFLDVDTEFKANFRVINANKSVRTSGILDFTRQPPSLAAEWAKKLVPLRARKEVMWQVVKVLRRLNTRYEQRAPVPPELRTRLKKEFAPEVERLGKLLGRDLSHWNS